MNFSPEAQTKLLELGEKDILIRAWLMNVHEFNEPVGADELVNLIVMLHEQSEHYRKALLLKIQTCCCSNPLLKDLTNVRR